MKKIFTLTMLALFAFVLGANAQEKKTWDFTKGLSDETVNNLNADKTNWASNGTDANGVTNNWQNSVKPSTSEELKANGEVIKETAGLLFDIGNNKANSIHIAQDKIRLTRDNTTITFPQLKDGQTITIVGRSANGDATDRGIAPVQDYIKYVGDEAQLYNGACRFLGNKVENSLGTYSFKFQVSTSSSDPVDVQFKLTPKGGIDFTLFMIDEGDEIQTANVAYLYNGTEDVVLNYLNAREHTTTTAVNVTTTAVTADELRGYDVVVVGASIPADNAAVTAVKEAMPWTPVLNLNGSLYAAWGYGEPVGSLGYVKIRSTKNALWDGVEYISDPDEGNVLVLANGSEVEAQAVKLGDYFAGDEILGTTLDEEAVPFIHTHNIKHNGYLYLPYVDNYSDAALQALNNAITMLFESKSEITATATPNIEQVFKDQSTIVSITEGRALPKTQFYYTTDGSTPTVETGTLYTEPFTLTATATVKAVAIAEGYTVSEVASADVAIYSQPKTPTISYNQEDGKTTITLACETPDVKIWYNFEGITDTIKSAVYTEPFVITMPQDVTAFSVAGGLVWSEVASQRILVKNPRVVIDVVSHFGASQWDGISNGGGIFSNGKTAASMYDTTQEGQKIEDPVTGDEIVVYPELEPMTKDEPGDNPQWMVTTQGQSVLWQNLGASTDKVGTNDGGYYPSASEDIDPLFPVTKNDIQFYYIFAGEKPNATIQTKNKIVGPMDIVVLANMENGPIVVEVSTDGTTWTQVGDKIDRTGLSRMWKKYVRSYNGTDEVYARVAQHEGGSTSSSGPKVFDIYIANQGEQSLALLEQLNEELTGIADVKTATRAAAGIYSINGIRHNGLKTGLNIVVEADGTVKKIIRK